MATDVANQVVTRGRREQYPLTIRSGVEDHGAGRARLAVQRPRITKLVAQGTRWCPLTVVTGPPGAGKTMALALWAAAEPGTVAWVGLDGFDNRPGAFWPYVVAALRRSGVAVPKALRACAQEGGRSRVPAAA